VDGFLSSAGVMGSKRPLKTSGRSQRRRHGRTKG
jgi:hypothetical protein